MSKLTATRFLSWALLVLLGLSVFWNLESDVANRERIAAMRDTLQIERGVRESLTNEAALLRDSAVTLQAKLDASNARLYAYSIHNAAQEATSDSLVALIGAMDSSAGAQIGVVIADLRGEITLCHSTLGLCDSLNVVLRKQNGALTELSLRNSATITTLTGWWEAAEKRARDRPFGIGATCGLAGNQQGFGFGCAVGLTYRVRLPWPFR